MICPRCKQERSKFKSSGECDYCYNMDQYVGGNPRYFLCPICGKAETPDDYIPFTWDNMNYCFGCEFWKEKEDLYLQGNLLVIDGWAFYMEDEDSKPTKGIGRGFGGSRFKVYRFDTGETFTTTNLWCNGQVPDRFRDVLKDNAKFLQEK